MLADDHQIDERPAADAQSKPASKTRLLTLADIDRRTRAYQRTSELIVDIENDLGGADMLATAERQLVQRAAVLGAVLEDSEARWLAGEPIDPTSYCTSINAQRRVFETLGTKRRPRDVVPTLNQFLQSKQKEPTDAQSS